MKIVMLDRNSIGFDIDVDLFAKLGEFEHHNTTDPANAKELILAPTRRAMEKNILPLWKGRIKLTLSSLEYENAPILGAAALAIREIEKKNVVVARRKIF